MNTVCRITNSSSSTNVRPPRLTPLIPSHPPNLHRYRSTNFGPPLFCNGKKSFYHLDNRRNKSGDPLDTQWLFPRDKYHGRAYSKYVNYGFYYSMPLSSYSISRSPDLLLSYSAISLAFHNAIILIIIMAHHSTPNSTNKHRYDPKDASLPPDGGWRIWKKSDPATTGAYDRESVDYIVDSEEGRKYYHYFKHMLLGSEEHYYVSLLYNWPRTQSFVQVSRTVEGLYIYC